MLGAVSHAQSPIPNTTIQFRASHPAPVSRFVAGRYYVYLPSIAILKKIAIVRQGVQFLSIDQNNCGDRFLQEQFS